MLFTLLVSHNKTKRNRRKPAKAKAKGGGKGRNKITKQCQDFDLLAQLYIRRDPYYICPRS